MRDFDGSMAEEKKGTTPGNGSKEGLGVSQQRSWPMKR